MVTRPWPEFREMFSRFGPRGREHEIAEASIGTVKVAVAVTKPVAMLSSRSTAGLGSPSPPASRRSPRRRSSPTPGPSAEGVVSFKDASAPGEYRAVRNHITPDGADQYVLTAIKAINALSPAQILTAHNGVETVRMMHAVEWRDWRA